MVKMVDESRNATIEQFSKKIDDVQSRVNVLSEKGKKRSYEQSPFSSQLFDELNILMEEVNVAAEELHQQSEELIEIQMELERERLKYRDLFDFAPDGYLVTDPHGMIQEANQAAGDLLKTSPERLVRKPLAQYVAMEHRKNFRIRLNQLNAHKSKTNWRIENWEFKITPRNANPVNISATVSAILAGKNLPGDLELFRWSLRDISDQKRIQEEVTEIKHELLKSRERSRQQLAHRLHDGPLQDLLGVIFQLKLVENEIEQPLVKKSVEKVDTQLIDIIQKLRLICDDLRPPTLAPFGLEKTIRSHTNTLRETHPKIQINLNVEEDLLFLPEEVSLVLFQIYLQAVTNTLLHSEANTLWVRLHEDEQKVYLEVIDDGKGFEVPKDWIDLVRNHHFGLADAMEKAASVGATLEVNSEPRKGTKVLVCLQKESLAG
jgi:PAS domain S-box-containing protein